MGWRLLFRRCMVGTEFDLILQQRRVTKADLARLMGVSAQYVGQIARGKRKVAPEFATKMEVSLGLAPGTLVHLISSPSPRVRGARALNSMEGIEVAYLGTAMAALADARHLVLRQRCHDALRPARGKSDTRFFDLAPEHALVQRIRQFDEECAVFTEEGTVDDRREYAERLCYFIDPLDRSQPFANAIEELSGESPYVVDAMKSPKWRLRGLDAPFASITCIRNSQICFNAMLDYTSGTIYVACKAMLKYGPLEKCSDPERLASFGEDIFFDAREGTDLITFVGHESSPKRAQYEQHLRDLGIGEESLPPSEYQVPGGPARILYLSEASSRSSNRQGDGQSGVDYAPALIMSNGEKICEWCGWLAYATHSDQLRVYEVYAEKFSSRDYILLAPPPNYSLFVVSGRGCSLRLDRVTGLEKPVRYRSAIVIAHGASSEAAVWMKAMKKEQCRELQLYHRDR